MRSKADAIDYKYFTEPNIPKFRITKELLDEVRSKIPVLAHERKEKYINEYGLSEYDAGVLTKDKKISDYFEECVSLKCDPKSACNWITTRVLGELNKSEENNIDDLKLGAKVHHPKFGLGTVVALKGPDVTIAFDNQGIKTINKEYTTLDLV